MVRREAAEHRTLIGVSFFSHSRMWRSTVFPEDENSDQSISEDDDLNEELLEDHISLGSSSVKKGEARILSQLDRLRDANEFIHERDQSSLLHERQNDDTPVEDDVEFPNFANKDEITYTSGNAFASDSDEEILSKNKVTGNYMQLSKCLTSEDDNYKTMNPLSPGRNRNGVCTWLAENAEGDAFFTADDDSDCASFHSLSSKLKKSSKGGQSKAKRKFSIQTESHSNSLFKDSSHAYESHTSIKVKEMEEVTNYMMSAEFPVSYTHSRTSVAELLLRVQDKHDLPEGCTMNVALCDKTEGQSKDQDVKRNILSTGHSDVDDDPVCLGSESSDENECNHQIQELIMPEYKQKTIADQFHEALCAASTTEDAVPQHTGFGLFGKLQGVMQREKEKDSVFLNKLQKEDVTSCLDVKILSKTLEGKLTVCLCSSIENDENTTGIDIPLSVIKRENMTIIFSSRTCDDVELDAGTLIRIHPPWKEVKVKGDDKTVILSTYFSQI